jgi:hypothetical protein
MSHTDSQLALEYSIRANVSEAQLREAVDQLWHDVIRKDPEVRSQLALPADAAVPQSLQRTPFEIETTPGADPVSVVLLVKAGTAGIVLGSKVLHDIWSKILLPRLLKKYGSESLQPLKPHKHH